MTSIEANLSAYFRGYGETNPDALRIVSTCPNWPDLARSEIERRMALLLENFTYREILAIASGEINLATIANSLLGPDLTI